MKEKKQDCFYRVNKKIEDDGHLYFSNNIKFELKKTGVDIVDHEGVEWVSLDCPHCNTYSRFSPLYTAVVDNPLENEERLSYFHTLAKCESCGDIIYICFSEYDTDPDCVFEYYYHFPQQTTTLDNGNIPHGVSEAFNEIKKCLQVTAYLASIVMCRRAIEAILDDKGIHERNLAKGIEALKTQGIVNDSISKLADAIRVVGNVGAHFSENNTISKEEAEQVYELTRKLIEIVYIIPSQVTQIKAIIDKRKSGK